MSDKTIAVFVLGPLDRSPRMLNHTFSLAEFTKLKVDFIGYEGSSMPKKLDDYKNEIRVKYINTKLIEKAKNLPYILYAFLRIILQIT